ncbi:unnamed protein product, partial [Wuchereria bancrofti]
MKIEREKFKSDLLYVCVSPKVVVKRIRTFLTFCVRYTGALSDCQYTMKHCGTDIVKHLPTSKYEWVEIDSNLCKAFANSKFVLSTLADMRKELAELGLKRLLDYGRAFKPALKKRYERPAAIKQALYRELERLPRAKEGNLRTTIEAIDRIIELLGFQGEDVNSTLIIYLIKQKLPKTNRRCSFCTKPHRTHECRKFSTPDERSKQVVELKLCFLCLKEGHRSKDCKASQCFKCGRRHHPALCSPANNTDNKVTKNTPVNQTTIHLATTETNATFANIRTSPNNLTPLWCIEGFASNPRNHHNSKKVMVLLDTGSERSYITKNLAQTLKMTDSQHETLSVGPFAATKPITMETRRLQVVLESQDRQTKEVVTVNTVPSILHRPLQYAKIKMNVRQRHDIQTALQEPELLLGADVISRILLPQTTLRQGNFIIIATTLGQIVTRAEPPQSIDSNVCTVTVDPVETFWNLELMGIKEDE